MGAAKNPRLLELDALRGIVALAVALFHFTILRPELRYGFNLGVTGVDMFFIISGFVIFLTLEKTKTWKDFVVGRLTRIYPAYWFCVTATTLVIVFEYRNTGAAHDPLPLRFLVNMSMFQDYFKIANIDQSYWTLRIETSFYLLMLGLFLTGKIRQVETLGAVGLLLCFLYDTASFKGHFQPTYQFLCEWIPLVCFYPLFFSGIIFYKIKFEKPTWQRYLMLILCFVSQCFLFHDGGVSRYYVSFPGYLGVLSTYYFLFILYVNNRLLFLVNRFTLFLGKISYSFYLIHQYVGTKFVVPLLVKSFHIEFWWATGIGLALMIGLATLITNHVERPTSLYFRKKFQGGHNSMDDRISPEPDFTIT